MKVKKRLSRSFTKESIFSIAIIFTLVHATFFSIFSAVTRRGDLSVFYIFIITIILIPVIKAFDRKYPIQKNIIILGSVLVLFHFLIASLYINGIRLADSYVINKIIRFDQIAYLLSSYFLVFILYPIIKKKLKDDHAKNFLLLITIFFTILGIFAVWEILQLMQVIFLNQTQNVGNYLNNAIDLAFGFFGILIGYTIKSSQKNRTK